MFVFENNIKTTLKNYKNNDSLIEKTNHFLGRLGGASDSLSMFSVCFFIPY
jgi:hypothetical protein